MLKKEKLISVITIKIKIYKGYYKYSISIEVGYWKLKQEALDHILWRTYVEEAMELS
jgi:hypothetical protein